MSTVPEALALALRYHEAGNLRQAEQIYHEILQVQPQNVNALHLLGVIAHHVGRSDRAVDYISQAVRLAPNFAEAHNSLGIALAAQGKLEEAVVSYQRGLSLKPEHVEAHNNLGVALDAQGKLEAAVGSFQQALRLKPDYTQAHNNLGITLTKHGSLTDAVASFQQALRAEPHYAEAHNNLAVALKEQGKLTEAVASSKEALRLKPDYAEAHHNLGTALTALGVLEEAVASHQRALRLKPDYVEAHNDLGIALAALGELDEAVASYQRALRLEPDFVEAHFNLGAALKQQGKLEAAVASYQQALHLRPDFAVAHNNLGNVLREQGQLAEAEASLQQALRLQPDAAHIRSNLVLSLLYHPGFDAKAIFEECQRWNQQHAELLKNFIRPHSNLPEPERRLRVGYVSSDFREHADSFFTIPLLSNHDHRQFEIFCYANVARPDAITDRLRGHADVWRCTVGLSAQQVAELVYSDRIDILVDLKLHTANNQLLVFARKPAPVQVTWLGYPGTTGLSAIDYRLTDPYLDPPGLFDAFYSEESIRLPDTFWCYGPLDGRALSVNALPASENGIITFGCLNDFCKINDGCLALWAKVLEVVPQSRFLLLAPRGQAREHVLARLEQEGIAAPRVEFADRQPRLEYLKLYHRIDMALDPLPYNGHTTSLDAFWMGVPTLTLVSTRTAFGRAGWSQLCNLGLQELGAETPEQFVALAARLAGDLSRLEELRSTLRQRMLRSPLMDGQRFAQSVEQAYRQIWHRWCSQTRPAQQSEGISPERQSPCQEISKSGALVSDDAVVRPDAAG